MKANSIKTVLFFCLILIELGCSKESLSPNGKQVTEVRSTAPFTAVSVSGSSQVTISYGEGFKVEVVGSDNLVTKFRTRVVNKELQLKYDDVNISKDDVHVNIQMPRLLGIRINGSSDMEISGIFPLAETFSAVISGSGNIRLQSLMLADQLIVELSGSGNADLQKAVVDQADVVIAGSGNLRAAVNDHLKVKINGSGNVYYIGSPVLETSVTGAGKAIKL
ncbi:DUF2807 domain-containing protein [Pedobacter sp. B4-66]|uniref:GIN domain-containing protein n=1 Tax=Pedobacter sp. B4-66 TaxID=2817280 RepID=UPI001BDAF54B|nr:DUF2807 domain-containing protein [Pedobacter sp. B4-66]